MRPGPFAPPGLVSFWQHIPTARAVGPEARVVTSPGGAKDRPRHAPKFFRPLPGIMPFCIAFPRLVPWVQSTLSQAPEGRNKSFAK